MSYATYLSNKLASQQKVVNVRNPTDASHYTHKKRLESTQQFAVDGRGLGSLVMVTDRPTGAPLNTHPSTSFQKRSQRPGDASTYTAYRGHVGISTDEPYRGNARKQLVCQTIPATDPSKYKTAADVTKDKLACDTSNALLHPAKFVDTTIRLSAAHPEIVTGACAITTSGPSTHTHSEGIHPQIRPIRAVTQTSTIVTSPPGFQNPGVGGARIGAYYNPRSGYVEKKHGNDLNVNPKRTPVPFAYKESIAHVKINNPTMAIVKPA